MNPITNPISFKKIAVYLALGILAVIALIVIYNYSTIEIIVRNGSDGSYSYTVKNQANNKQTSLTSSSNSLKQYAPRGSYEVTVSQNGRTYFGIAKTTGFFGNTTINADLQSERQRTFVGENPSSCMNLLGTVLFSHDCSSSSTLRVHIPATQNQPTYTDTEPPTLGRLEGNVKTTEGDLALFAVPLAEQEPPKVKHTIYQYHMDGSTIKLTSQAQLSDLGGDTSTTYSLAPYKAGFIAYNSAYDSVWYYPSIHATPTKITLGQPNQKGMGAVSLSAAPSGSIAVAYATQPDDQGSTQAKQSTEVVISTNGTARHYVYRSRYTSVRFCGETKLCMLNSNTDTVEIRDTSNLRLLYELPNVNNIIDYPNGLIAVQPDRVLRVNTETFTGSTDYTFGKYQYCGAESVPSGYVLCIVHNGNKAALYIDPAQSNSDNYDKKFADVETMLEVSSLTINGRFVYIVPMGKLVHNPTTKSFGPDPVVQKTVNAAINKKIDELGIDRKAYTIIFTGPQT